MSQLTELGPYLLDAPWPAARGGLANAGRHAPAAGSEAPWQVELGAPAVGAPLVGPGGRIWVGTLDGRVHRVDPSGGPAWAVDVGSPVGASGCLGREGLAVWPLVDGSLVALRDDGTFAWRWPDGAHPTPTLLAIRGLRAPLVRAADGAILTGSDDTHLYALRPDGSLSWATALGLPVRGIPAATVDGGIVVAGLDAVVTRLSAADGRVVWRQSVGHAVMGGLATDGAHTGAVGTAGGRVLGLDLARGRLEWTAMVRSPVVAPPACLGRDEGWVVATIDGQVRALSPRGKTRWIAEIGEHVRVGPVVSSAGRGDGMVLIGTQDGGVHVLDVADGTHRGHFAVAPTHPVPQAIVGLALGPTSVVVTTTAGVVAVRPWSTLQAERPAPPAPLPADAHPSVVRLAGLHLDEPSLLGGLDPTRGLGVTLDVSVHDLGTDTIALGRWRDAEDPEATTWVVFDVEDDGDSRTLSTPRLPLRPAAGITPLRGTFTLPCVSTPATAQWTVAADPGLTVPDLTSVPAWFTHASALIERAGKPFVAARKAFDDLQTSTLPDAGTVLSQLWGLSSAAPRFLAAVGGLVAPSRWRAWGVSPTGLRGGGRCTVTPFDLPGRAGVVDHVTFDAVRRRFVAEVGDPRGRGLHPDDLVVVLVRDGRRVDVDVVQKTSVTVRRGVVTDVVLELPLDLVVDASLEAWVVVNHRVVWRGPMPGEDQPPEPNDTP